MKPINYIENKNNYEGLQKVLYSHKLDSRRNVQLIRNIKLSKTKSLERERETEKSYSE